MALSTLTVLCHTFDVLAAGMELALLKSAAWAARFTVGGETMAQTVPPDCLRASRQDVYGA